MTHSRLKMIAVVLTKVVSNTSIRGLVMFDGSDGLQTDLLKQLVHRMGTQFQPGGQNSNQE
jgi:hypothetical protein